MDVCPVCKDELKSPAVSHQVGTDAVDYECPRCGNYSLTGSASATLPSILQADERAAIKLSHVLYSMTEREAWPILDSELLRNICSEMSLPSLSEQLNNLITWLAKNQPGPCEAIFGTSRTEAATGVVNHDHLLFICDHAKNSKLIKGTIGPTGSGLKGGIQLTFEGWSYFEELQRGSRASRTAFMAMKYGDVQLDAIYLNHFKEAVLATGFKLKRNDEAQKAGLIDDHMRVEIRQSRFLIADLTHFNQGAYWEAGFAEGLGKPVIYTCHKDAFEEQGTHFDTNHHLTVKWDPENIGEAVEKLKATIRATLPEEAKLST